MEIQNAAGAYAARPVEAVGTIVPVVSLPQVPAETLGPAATVDLSAGRAPTPPTAPSTTDPQQRRYSVDPDSRQIVFQIFDSGSGTVVEQLPDESTLRARAYARETVEAHQGQGAKALDRSA